jgi:biotin carboxylase
MARATPLVAIVDPYSAAHGFAPAFRARGVGAVAMRTAFALPPGAAATWEPAHFSHILDATRSLPAVQADLAGLAPVRILPGSESGVRLAEELTGRLLPETGNVARLAAARQDKWQTALALAAAGVAGLAQVAAADPAEVVAWQARHGLAGAPLVLKPTTSAGADSIYLVRRGEDWRPPFDQILGARNMMGRRNDVVLVQEYAEGVEYAVDTYSADGRHGLVMVSRYRKRVVGDRLGIYEAVECLPPDAPRVSDIVGYARAVLDAVGLRNGSAHLEVMDTARGPRLIEVNARVAGNPQQEMTRLATADSQIDRCVRHVVDGEPGDADYRLRQHVTVAFLSAPATGILADTSGLRAIADLPTCHRLQLAAGTGDRVEQTTDLFTSLGFAILAGGSAAEVAADYAVVREREARVGVAAGVV